MKLLVLIILMAGIWYWLDTPYRRRRRVENSLSLRIRTSKSGTISFTELAFMRKDLLTASSMIKLGLVEYKFGGATEAHLQDAYLGRPLSSQATKTAKKFGLIPHTANFVGHTPEDRNQAKYQ